jgi:hypothetical protein
MAADVSLEKDYTVRKKNVFLSLTIGEGQFGTSDVFLGTERLIRTSGSFGKLKLGSGSELTGRVVKVRSVINDVSSATNRMSIKYLLDGGAAAKEFIARAQVAEEGDLLVFEAIFKLVAE